MQQKNKFAKAVKSFVVLSVHVVRQSVITRLDNCKFIDQAGTPELGGQEGQLPPLPFAGRGKGGKSAL